MVIKIHLLLNQALQAGINTEIEIKHLSVNENSLDHPLTGNMKNKDLPLFIAFSTIRCNAIASIYVPFFWCYSLLAHFEIRLSSAQFYLDLQ